MTFLPIHAFAARNTGFSDRSSVWLEFPASEGKPHAPMVFFRPPFPVIPAKAGMTGNGGACSGSTGGNDGSLIYATIVPYPRDVRQNDEEFTHRSHKVVEDEIFEFSTNRFIDRTNETLNFSIAFSGSEEDGGFKGEVSGVVQHGCKGFCCRRTDHAGERSTEITINELRETAGGNKCRVSGIWRIPDGEAWEFKGKLKSGLA